MPRRIIGHLALDRLQSVAIETLRTIKSVMCRRLLLIFLLLSALVQTMALGSSAAFAALASNDAATAGHATLHWQKKPHHHHKDGSVSQDHSDESTRHVVADGVLGSGAVLPTLVFFFPWAEAARPVMTDEPERPWPYLDGLRRPPRLAA